MQTNNRRTFLKQFLSSGAFLATAPWLASIGYTQTSGPASAMTSKRYQADNETRMLGAFLEHMGRAIYTGVYEPGSKLADASGLRKDVMTEIRGLAVPIMMSPGGNFVSGYNWLDG